MFAKGAKNNKQLEAITPSWIKNNVFPGFCVTKHLLHA